jgi:hypothetical protein
MLPPGAARVKRRSVRLVAACVGVDRQNTVVQRASEARSGCEKYRRCSHGKPVESVNPRLRRYGGRGRPAASTAGSAPAIISACNVRALLFLKKM